jgi:hypothetical protein
MTKSLEPTHGTHIDKQPFLYGDPRLHISREKCELRFAGWRRDRFGAENGAENLITRQRVSASALPRTQKSTNRMARRERERAAALRGHELKIHASIQEMETMLSVTSSQALRVRRGCK